MELHGQDLWTGWYLTQAFLEGSPPRDVLHIHQKEVVQSILEVRREPLGGSQVAHPVLSVVGMTYDGRNWVFVGIAVEEGFAAAVVEDSYFAADVEKAAVVVVGRIEHERAGLEETRREVERIDAGL